MGGGASLMVPMKFSVVTEKTVSLMSFESASYSCSCLI